MPVSGIARCLFQAILLLATDSDHWWRHRARQEHGRSRSSAASRRRRARAMAMQHEEHRRQGGDQQLAVAQARDQVPELFLRPPRRLRDRADHAARCNTPHRRTTSRSAGSTRSSFGPAVWALGPWRRRMPDRSAGLDACAGALRVASLPIQKQVARPSQLHERASVGGPGGLQVGGEVMAAYIRAGRR